MIRYLLVLSIIFVENPVSASSRTSKSRKKPKSSESAGRVVNNSKRNLGSKSGTTFRFGAGAGIQSIYLPSLGFEAFIVTSKFQLGGEVGFFQLSQSEFRGSTSFFGLSGRWQIYKNSPLFVGISFGSRNVSLTTSADLTYTDASIGSTTTSVSWTRQVSQMLFYPKVGWQWTARRSAVAAAAGLMIPLSSKAAITGNPPSADGISEEDYQATADSKLKDVTKTTHAIMPGLELKYFYFLN